MRAVLDVNVLVSALISRSGAPAELLRRWLGGGFELVVSEQLLDELERTLAYPKLLARIDPDSAEAFVELLRRRALRAPDPSGAAAARTRDAGDEYLLRLAESQQAYLVSGDAHLLELAGTQPVRAPRAFLDVLGD